MSAQKFHQQEVNIIITALQQRKGGVPRRFEYSKLAAIADIRKKLRPAEDKDGSKPDRTHLIDFTVAEKRVILNIVQELDWMLGDAPHVIEIAKKLQK